MKPSELLRFIDAMTLQKALFAHIYYWIAINRNEKENVYGLSKHLGFDVSRAYVKTLITCNSNDIYHFQTKFPSHNGDKQR